MDTRPTLSDPADKDRAWQIATAFADTLQGSNDADGYDSAFAADILWGSPYGATVAGYAEINAIHRRLVTAHVAPPSRFEIVSALAPAPGVVVTQIRRRAIDSGGFSEMALYVLIERDGRWWLTAAQNTPIAAAPQQSA
ncbi:DUF4440 domain-containing protein [Nocardia panacis]|uniref:DUF4440 domain-containing protein n=1 Tax=Nocardia panacis TaxID=2340916 RepID=UPI00193A96A2|nr:DUF4440 domain-containing protein [Nocardia panacis]